MRHAVRLVPLEVVFLVGAVAVAIALYHQVYSLYIDYQPAPCRVYRVMGPYRWCITYAMPPGPSDGAARPRPR